MAVAILGDLNRYQNGFVWRRNSAYQFHSPVIAKIVPNVERRGQGASNQGKKCVEVIRMLAGRVLLSERTHANGTNL